jgi:hypothetical protein
VFFWPAKEERLEISARIKQRHFGFIDGTHLGLSTRPESCGEEYFTRKGKYAVPALLTHFLLWMIKNVPPMQTLGAWDRT